MDDILEWKSRCGDPFTFFFFFSQGGGNCRLGTIKMMRERERERACVHVFHDSCFLVKCINVICDMNVFYMDRQLSFSHSVLTKYQGPH